MVKFLRFILFSVLPAVLLAAAALPLSGVSAQDAPPATPPDLWASQGMHAKYVEVRWTGVDGAFYYLVTRTEPGGYTWVKRVTKKTAFDDHRAKPGIVYQYQIQACDKQGCSLPGAPVDGWAGACVSLPEPGLIYPADGEVVRNNPDLGEVQLHWEIVTGADMYQIQVMDADSGQILFDETSHDTYHTLNYLADGDYRWRVRALDDDNEGCPGQWSVIWSFTSLAYPPPPAPVNVQASQGTYPNKIIITWDQPQGETPAYDHYVLRYESLDGDYLHFYASGSTYEDLQVEPGKRYYYRVEACHPSRGCSLSDPATGWAGDLP